MPQEKKQPNISNNPMMALFAELDVLITTSVKKEEVAQIVKTLIDVIKATEERISDNVASNKGESDSALSELQRQLRDVEQRLRASLIDTDSKSTESLNNAIKQLRDEVKRVQNMIPELPDYTERFAEVESKIPTIKKDDEMQKEIHNLEKEVVALKKEMKRVSQAPSGGGGGIVGRDLVRNYDLSAYLDGSTKTFNIPAIWSIVSVATSSFPNVLRPIIDYTYTGQTITFTSEIDETTTLASGQTVVLTIVSM